jgi:hypothetical protein
MEKFRYNLIYNNLYHKKFRLKIETARKLSVFASAIEFQRL